MLSRFIFSNTFFRTDLGWLTNKKGLHCIFRKETLEPLIVKTYVLKWRKSNISFKKMTLGSFAHINNHIRHFVHVLMDCLWTFNFPAMIRHFHHDVVTCASGKWLTASFNIKGISLLEQSLIFENENLENSETKKTPSNTVHCGHSCWQNKKKRKENRISDDFI